MKRYAMFLLVVLGVFLVGVGCDDDKKGSDFATVFGTITFENVDVWTTWEDSGEVLVTIFPEFSLDPLSGWGQVPDDFFGPGVPGGLFAVGAPYNAQNPLALTRVPGQTVYQYSIEDLEAGTYSALAVGLLHDNITDPTIRTATLGVHWENPDSVSHGVEVRVDIGGGTIVTVFSDVPPSPLTLSKGEERELNFKADFAFVNVWYQ